MNPKGWILRNGKVVQSIIGREDEVVASLHYKETRYNLRRVFVTKEWIAITDDGGREWGRTRAEVVQKVLQRASVKS